jgi:hypothetical protein
MRESPHSSQRADSEPGGESDSGAEGGWDANCAFYKSCGRGNGCSATDQKQRLTRSQTVRNLHEKQECEAEAVQPLGTRHPTEVAQQERRRRICLEDPAPAAPAWQRAVL